jgi:hypothetical protein
MTGRFVKKLTEAEIDAAFAEMAHDEEYLNEALRLTREFEVSDWEAYRLLDAANVGRTRGRI